MTLQWIPARCQIQGNEVADGFAESGSQLEQPQPSASCGEKKTLVKTAWAKTWQHNIPPTATSKMACTNCQGNPKEPSSDSELVMVRSGQTYLNSVKPVLQCTPVGLKNRQLPTSCKTSARGYAWPTPSTLSDKLWGSLASLEQISSFLDEAEILT